MVSTEKACEKNTVRYVRHHQDTHNIFLKINEFVSEITYRSSLDRSGLLGTSEGAESIGRSGEKGKGGSELHFGIMFGFIEII